MLRLLRALASVIASLLLAFTLAAAGLWVCCLPITTELLAKATSGSENPTTPFTTDELVTAALATREYTVGGHNLEELYEVHWGLNTSTDAENDPHIEALQQAAAEFAQAGTVPSTAELQDYLTGLDLERVLDANAISHLDDVNNVIVSVELYQIVGLTILVLCLILLGLRGGIRWIGGVLLVGGMIVIVAFVGCGLWALFDFNGFFTALHSAFFSQGNWTFDMDSLLITMYPTNFWIGMGIVWLATTLLLSMICAIVGAKLRK